MLQRSVGRFHEIAVLAQPFGVADAANSQEGRPRIGRSSVTSVEGLGTWLNVRSSMEPVPLPFFCFATRNPTGSRATLTCEARSDVSQVEVTMIHTIVWLLSSAGRVESRNCPHLLCLACKSGMALVFVF